MNQAIGNWIVDVNKKLKCFLWFQYNKTLLVALVALVVVAAVNVVVVVVIAAVVVVVVN